MRQDWENVVIVGLIAVVALVYGLILTAHHEAIKVLVEQQQKIEFLEDVIKTRKWVDREHWSVLQAQVQVHSSNWAKFYPTTKWKLDSYRDYWDVRE